MVFEIRTYIVVPGALRQFLEVLQGVVVPALTDAGVDVISAGASDAAGDAVVDSAYLVTAHRSAADAAASDTSVTQSPAWRDGPATGLPTLVVSEHRVVIPRAALVGLGLRP